MAVPTPVNTTNFANAMDRGIRKFFVDRYKAQKPKLEMVAQVGDQADYQETRAAFTGMGDMQVVEEGTKYPVGAPLQMYTTTYTSVKYGDTISVTHEAQFWDKTNLTDSKKLGEMQANQVIRKIEKNMADVYIKGFNTSYTSYGDSKPLFSGLHTRADGGTANSNASSTSTPLTEANLETAIVAMQEQLDDRGEFIMTEPRILLVPPQLLKEAIIITKSDQRSGTADNDINVNNMADYYGGRLKVVSWTYLGAAAGGSDTAWFLLDPNVHQVKWLWGEKPMIGELDKATGNLYDEYFWKVRFQADTGWDDWRGVWGSQGTGAAYAS